MQNQKWYKPGRMITVRDIYPFARTFSRSSRTALISEESWYFRGICKIRLRLDARWPQNYGGWSVGFMEAPSQPS